MKTKSSVTESEAAGFTLIELLVVIAIIGILVGILMPVVAGMKAKAQTQQAMAEVKGMAMAVRAFHTEYNQWPVPNNLLNVGGTWSNNNIMVFGRLVAGGEGNPHNINFLQLSNTVDSLSDPFGPENYYVVRISVTNNSVKVWAPSDSSISATY